jgi:radical SAM-linked protein
MSEPEGRGGAWTEERRRSDEGRRRLEGAPEASGKHGVAGPDRRPAQLPAVQHLVVRYAKRGKMRFASHRDVARAFERGVRRAGLPIAYSAGFTPHPKISYAGGAPTGVASEAEYLSLALTSRQAATHVSQRLNAALPDGIEVIDVTEQSPRADEGAFGRLEASQWRVVLPGVESAAAQRAVAGFLALSQAPVERLTDKGVRSLDARAAIIELDVLAEHDPAGSGGRVPQPSVSCEAADPDGGPRAAMTGLEDCAILRMVVLHTAPAVRPDDVLTALRDRYGLVPSSPPTTTRLEQGPLVLLAGTKV